MIKESQLKRYFRKRGATPEDVAIKKLKRSYNEMIKQESIISVVLSKIDKNLATAEEVNQYRSERQRLLANINELKESLALAENKIEKVGEVASKPKVIIQREEVSKDFIKNILELEERVSSIKPKDFSNEIEDLSKRISNKQDRIKLPKEIDIKPTKTIGVIKDESNERITFYLNNKQPQSIAVLKGSQSTSSGTTLYAGDNITIQGQTISAISSSGSTFYAGSGIDITGSTVTNTLPGVSLQAGNNITINGLTISASGGGSTVYAGNGINITGGTITNTLGFVGTGGVSVFLTGNTYTIFGLSSALNTNQITEGVSNFYYTEARFNSSLGTKTTNNLSEGSSGLYYSQQRFDSDLALKTTDNLSEGVSNFYYKPNYVIGTGGVSISVTGKTITVFGLSSAINTDQVLEGNSNFYFKPTYAVGTGGVSVSVAGKTITIYGLSTALNTNNATEGASGLFYSTQRFSTDFGNKTTNDLTQGTSNFYYQPTYVVGTGGVSISVTGKTITVFGLSTAVNSNNITEGSSGLFYSSVRFDASLATKTTNNLTEGTSNFYYTEARFTTSLGTKTTNNLTEGTSSFYWRSDRVSAGSGVSVIRNGVTVTIQASSSASPGGVSGQFQYNNGTMAGNSFLSYQELDLTGDIIKGLVIGSVDSVTDYLQFRKSITFSPSLDGDGEYTTPINPNGNGVGFNFVGGNAGLTSGVGGGFNMTGGNGVNENGGDFIVSGGVGDGAGKQSGSLRFSTQEPANGANGGYVYFRTRTGSFLFPGAEDIKFDTNGGNQYKFGASNLNYSGILDFSTLSSDRTFNFPDNSGTLSLAESFVGTGGASVSVSGSTVTIYSASGGGSTVYSGNGLAYAGLTLNISDGDKGHITVSGSGSTWSINETMVELINVVTVPQSGTSAGYAGITNLMFTMGASMSYTVDGFVIYNSGTSAMGVLFGVNSPAGSSLYIYSQKTVTNTGAASTDSLSTALLRANDTPLPNSTAEPSVTVPLLWKTDGVVINAGTSGLFQLRVSKENVAGTWTVMPGSYLKYRRII